MKLSLLDSISQNAGEVVPSGPIAIFELTQFNNAASNTVFNTAAFTPTANRLVLATVFADSDPLNAAIPISVTGNGMTWVLVNSKVQLALVGKSAAIIAVYRAMSAAPANGALTVTFGAAQNTVLINVTEFSNVDTSGVDGSGAIAQSGTASSNSSANPSLALAAVNPNAKNAVIGFSSNEVNPYAATPEAGWTEYRDTGFAVGIYPCGEYITYQLLSTDSTIAISKAMATCWVLVGIEINAAP